MRVAHIGPPLAQQGGPAGYLRQLQRAAAASGDSSVLFPEAAAPRPPSAPPSTARRLRRAASTMKRRLGFRPNFYRPSDDDLRKEYGSVHELVTAANATVVSEAQASLDRAMAANADVLFCHEPAVAERALDRRRPGQSVWLIIHCPVPAALYLAWTWGVPEKDWRELVELADVQRWMRWETDVWGRIDRVIIPCREAFDGFLRAAPFSAPCEPNLTYLASGATLAGDALPSDRAAARRRFQLPADTPVGLFIGSPQPYRGLDLLMQSLDSIDARVPGLVAVAGPPADSLARHRRLRALGPVKDVAALLSAVDFVINVNRFSLFDLSTIEALEAGKPLLMHAVGGNVTFARLGAGCRLFESLDPPAVAAALGEMFALDARTLDDMGRASRASYDAHLTPALFWKRHRDLYASAMHPA